MTIQDDPIWQELEEMYYQEQESGQVVCPWCGNSKPVGEMTANAMSGTICWDCDIEMAGETYK